MTAETLSNSPLSVGAAHGLAKTLKVWHRKYEIAANVDLHLAVHRRQHDVLHQRPDDIGGFCPLLLVLTLQGVVEALNARAVELDASKNSWCLARPRDSLPLRDSGGSDGRAAGFL